MLSRFGVSWTRIKLSVNAKWVKLYVKLYLLLWNIWKFDFWLKYTYDRLFLKTTPHGQDNIKIIKYTCILIFASSSMWVKLTHVKPLWLK